MACSAVSHEKALHYYFIPCLNLRKTYGNFGKSSETSANFRKLRKRVKPVFEEHSSKVIFRCFCDFLKFSENLRKSSEVFGNLRKFSENFGNGSKVIFRCFYDFLKYSKNLRKSSEVFENLRKRFPNVIGNVRNGSKELKGFGARF